MVGNSNQAAPKVPPKWVVWAMLIGALCAFAAAGLALARNGEAAIVVAVMALVLYVAGGVGFARALRRVLDPGAVNAVATQAEKKPE